MAGDVVVDDGDIVVVVVVGVVVVVVAVVGGGDGDVAGDGAWGKTAKERRIQRLERKGGFRDWTFFSNIVPRIRLF